VESPLPLSQAADPTAPEVIVPMPAEGVMHLIDETKRKITV
jgi:hypothetical protein